MLEDIEEDHLDLIISPYLKHLDVRHIDKELIRGIADRLKANGSGVETVKARFSKLLTECLIPSLSHLVDIEIGGFRGTHASSIHGVYTSEMIKALGRHCPELKVLKLRDKGDEYSAGHCLLSQEVGLCPVLCEAVCFLLDRCPSLEILENINTVAILYKKHQLDLRNNDLDKCRKYSLTKLSFLTEENYPLLDAYKICFSLCPKVTCIELQCIDGNHLVKSPNFLALQDVKILAYEVSVSKMNEFLKIKGRRLVNLELYHSCISVNTIIQCCPELERLRLSNVQQLEAIKQEDFSTTGFPKLKSFTLHKASFYENVQADVVKLIISVAKNLRYICFQFVDRFSEEFCNSLFELGLHRVRELVVSYTDIPLSFLIKLLSEGNLQSLRVRFCNLVSTVHARDTLPRFKRENQTVKVMGNDRYPRDEWDFRDQYSFSGSDYDSDVDSDSDTGLEE